MYHRNTYLLMEQSLSIVLPASGRQVQEEYPSQPFQLRSSDCHNVNLGSEQFRLNRIISEKEKPKLFQTLQSKQN